MKLLFLHHGGARGGAPISLLTLLEYLPLDGAEVKVVNTTGDPEVTEIFGRSGFAVVDCEVIRFPHTTLGSFDLRRPSGWRSLYHWYRAYPRYLQNLHRLLVAERPDLVHLNSLTLAPYACIPRRLGISCVVHVREPILRGWFGFRKWWLNRHLRLYADRVIAICHDNLDRLKLAPGQGTVVYNPVDFSHFDARLERQTARNILGVPQDAAITLFAGGTIAEVKGLQPYLRAMGDLKAKVPRLVCLMPSFVWPNDPNARHKTLRKYIARLLGVYRRFDRLYTLLQRNELYTIVFARPFTREMPIWIAAANVVCVPHIKPHFSRTVMEAGAMQRPVVAFQIGGVEEVVGNGVTGLLVDPGDVAELGQAVKKLLDDPQLADRLGEGGYRQAREKFAAEHSARAIYDIFRDLLAGGGDV